MSTQNQKPSEFSVTFQTSGYVIEYVRNGNFELHKTYKMIEKSAFQKAVNQLKEWHKFEKENVAKEGPYVGKRINELIVATRETLRELGLGDE